MTVAGCRWASLGACRGWLPTWLPANSLAVLTSRRITSLRRPPEMPILDRLDTPDRRQGAARDIQCSRAGYRRTTNSGVAGSGKDRATSWVSLPRFPGWADHEARGFLLGDPVICGCRYQGPVPLWLVACCLKDRPADLGPPCRTVIGAPGPEVVDLTDRSRYFQGVPVDVGAQGCVGDVDVVTRADVHRGGLWGFQNSATGPAICQDFASRGSRAVGAASPPPGADRWSPNREARPRLEHLQQGLSRLPLP
jgi:hypothetical protein